MGDRSSTGPPQEHRILPDELTACFRMIGLGEGDRVVMYASFSGVGVVEGGAAMVLHRLLRLLGKKGTLLMPTFTSITRHSFAHDNFTKAGCWCDGRESRHLPFISELQPDKELGEVSHRLCSWPASRRSNHPAYSFAAVGNDSDELVRRYSLTDPLQPVREFLKQNPFVLTVGVGLESVSAIQVANQQRVPASFVKERALTITSSGSTWVELTAMGCSYGFGKLENYMSQSQIQRADIGGAKASLYSMKNLIQTADSLLSDDVTALSCGRPACLSCQSA